MIGHGEYSRPVVPMYIDIGLLCEKIGQGGLIHLAFVCSSIELGFKELWSMILASNGQAAIIRTERGLTIAGTRITLYDIMDYVTAEYPPKFIRGLFDLTLEQINAALAYIETHRAEVEAEYQQVLKESEELRQYYEEQNRELVARISAQPPKPGTEAAWEKLRAAKAKRESKA